jgi:signal transduction histidine kinase
MVVLQSGERVPALGRGTSRMIMRAHRGTVRIEDNAESGAVFISILAIKLPTRTMTMN